MYPTRTEILMVLIFAYQNCSGYVTSSDICSDCYESRNARDVQNDFDVMADNG